jgi:hypothetical protein
VHSGAPLTGYSSCAWSGFFGYCLILGGLLGGMRETPWYFLVYWRRNGGAFALKPRINV